MDCKLIKKAEITITCNEMNILSEELEETHCGHYNSDSDSIETDTADLQSYIDSSETAHDPHKEAIAMAKKALAFAQKHGAFRVSFV